MKRKFFPLPGEEEAPFYKLSDDYELTMNPLICIQQNLLSYIQEYIFSENYERKLSIKNLPENEDNYIIPNPKYD